MLFTLTRCLIDAGVDATLLLQNNELWQFHPSYDTFDFSFRDFTAYLDWGDPTSFHEVSPARIRESLADFDFLIGINTAPAFCHKAGRFLDLFIPHGNDLYKLPRVHTKMRWDQRLRQPRAVRFFEAQRQGIRETWVTNHEDSHPEFQKILREVGIEKQTYYFGFPMVYPEIYAPGRIELNYDRSAWYREFKAVRDANEFLVFNGNQQMWTVPYEPDRTFLDDVHKGTDRLLKGYALFLKRRPLLRAQMFQFEYGPDVRASQQLINELGIADRVTWFPTLARKELMVALSLSDCGCGQFFNGCVGGGTTWEVLTSGKPLLHYRRPSLPVPGRFSGDFPHFNVLAPDEIAEAFEKIVDHPQEAREMGFAGVKWYRQNLVEGPVSEILNMISLKKAGGDLRSWRAERVARFSLLDQQTLKR